MKHAVQKVGSEGSAAGRGRPAATSAEDISLVAVRLFEQRGYAAVTMEDIAEALGVGRRTLFSYYRSKSAIVWDGQRRAVDAWVAALRAAPAGVGWREAIADALARALEFPGDDLELMRSRLVVIARNAELQSHLLTEQEAFAAALVSLVAEREGLDPADLMPAVAARAVLAALSTALIWWATSGLEDPRPVIRDALSGLLRPEPDR